MGRPARTMLQRTKPLLGSVRRFPIPEHVWSPAGGWWADPPNWESNTRWAFAGMMSIAAGLFYVSSQVERRAIKPIRPIPSEMWCAHKPGDLKDPLLPGGE